MTFDGLGLQSRGPEMHLSLTLNLLILSGCLASTFGRPGAAEKKKNTSLLFRLLQVWYPLGSPLSLLLEV